VVLLPRAKPKRRSQEKINEFSQYVGLPIVPVIASDLDTARQEFLLTAMRIAPATGLALAAHIPHFRFPLMRNLLDTATEESLYAGPGTEITAVQMSLVHQICAAYGHNGHQFESHKAALKTLMTTTAHYTTRLVVRFPIRDRARRARLTNAMSTLFIGYATAIYLGATPPSFRKELLPQVWRLYRASRKSLQE